jgi:hypothetical protein
VGQAGQRPPVRPGYPVYRPGYGYGSRYPYYGYRGYYPYYGYRWYYPYSFPGFYWGVGGYFGSYYGGAWGYPYYWSDPYGYGYAYGATTANLKVNVEPKTAEVYVDGHLAGIVDQYDGLFQSLTVEAGDHEITIYQEGFRTMRQSLYLSPGSTYRIKGVMERLAPGEPMEPRPQPPYAQPSYGQPAYGQPAYAPPPAYEPPRPEPQYQGPPPDQPVQQPAVPPPADGRYGQLAIRVQPADAEVLIDGEPWRSPAGADRLVVALAPGTHRVEIRREGYDPFVTAIDVRRGETTPLNVSLARF